MEEGAEHQPWHRMTGEPLIWFQRFEKFRLMEPVRRISEVYYSEHPKTPKNGDERRNLPGDWYKNAKKWNWEQRALAYDAYQDSLVEQQILAERKKVLQSGFAVMHRRVQALDALSRKLLKEASRDDRLWLPDVKSIGTGPLAKRVDLLTFNEGLIRQIRGCLDDLASELGERVKKAEVKADVHSSGQIGVYLPEKHELSEVEAAPTPEESTPEYEASPYLQMPQKHTLEGQEAE